MTPRVSVVLPTRDRLSTLQRALSGVEAQSFRDFEVLVVDDQSVDGSVSWLREKRPGIRLFEMEKSGGAGSARNRGIQHARGELIAFLDDDDLWRPSYLEAQVEHLDANPTAALSYADHVEIDSSRGRASRPDTQPLLAYPSPLVRILTESFIHSLSVIVCRRQLFDRFGRFDESLAIVHDLDWYLRILGGGASFIHLPRALVGRAVPGGLVRLHRRWYREEQLVLDRAFAGTSAHRASELMVRTYRSLFFSRVGLAKGDLTFGLLRLAEALISSPYWTINIAARRLLRRMRHERGSEAWDATAMNAR